MITPSSNAFILLYAVGIFPVLVLSSTDVADLNAEDLALLRDDCGAGEPMLDELRARARTPGQRFALDFEKQQVTVDTGDV